jgi:hypothetical protein
MGWMGVKFWETLQQISWTTKKAGTFLNLSCLNPNLSHLNFLPFLPKEKEKSLKLKSCNKNCKTARLSLSLPPSLLFFSLRKNTKIPDTYEKREMERERSSTGSLCNESSRILSTVGDERNWT